MRLGALLWGLGLCCTATFSQTNQKHKEELIEQYYTRGIAVRPLQKDSSLYYFDLAYNYSVELENYSDALHILNESIKTSGRHFDLTKYASYLARIEAILQNDSIKKRLEDGEYFEDRFTYEQGKYFFNLRDFSAAKPLFRRLFKTYSTRNIGDLATYELSNLVHSVNYLASIYLSTGKYELAENYYKRSLSFLEKSNTKITKALESATDRQLTDFYIQTENYEKAGRMLNDLLQVNKTLYEKDKNFKGNLISIYHRLIENSIQQDSLSRASMFIDECQKYLLEDDSFRKKSHLLSGTIYSALGDTERAFASYNMALNAYREYRNNLPHQDVAEVYGKISELQLKEKNYQEGLKTIQEAFNAAGSQVLITDFNENPEPDNVFSKTQLLHLLDVKLQLLQGSFAETADATYQNATLQTSRDILSTFDLLKSEFDSKLDKQFLADRVYPIFHRLLETAHRAYEINPSEETLQLALNIAEKNKDFILLEALRNAQANQYGIVPQGVLDKEAQLRAGITHIEKQIFDAAENEIEFSEDLFKLKQEYYSFLDTIKTNYPKYHELKYQNIALDQTMVREKILDDNGTLISYTMTADNLYVIVLNDSKEDFLKLPFSDADKADIREFYKILSSPTIGDSEQAISDLGKSLYAKILKKPLAGFDGKNLLIIPDGELHYLPFDLLRETTSYLLHSTTIAYGNSVNSLLELKSKKKSKKNQILAFAPFFTGAAVANTDREFGKLLYNDEEVSKIGAFYDTETVLSHQATLENFKAKIADFNVLHLATHASANDEYPDYSYLAFTQTKDTSAGNILYIKDLYNMALDTDMVTLSACQTGIGKLQKGQGMLSLSKGFYYAGAKSLVNTLWKINDKSTVSLMEFFYEALSEGKSKKEALREAKLKYLASIDDDLLKHPYYWAAFTVSGNTDPLQGSSTKWWWLLLPVPILGLWWMRRKYQSN